MSGSSGPTSIGPFTLLLSNNTSATPGNAVFPITITNSDGTAPVLASDNTSIVTTSITGPNADGSYTGTVTAVSDGATGVTVSADGQVDVTIGFIVQQAPLEVASVDPTAVVINNPGSTSSTGTETVETVRILAETPKVTGKPGSGSEGMAITLDAKKAEAAARTAATPAKVTAVPPAETHPVEPANPAETVTHTEHEV
jgi:hypothetical protein